MAKRGLFRFFVAFAVILSSLSFTGCSPNKDDLKSGTVPSAETGKNFTCNNIPDSRPGKKLYYIVSDTRIPFWEIMSRGVRDEALQKGYELTILSSSNDIKSELRAFSEAIRRKSAGIILSPTNSSACSTLLKLAKNARIPVVISDIGTDNGDYVSYVSSDNEQGGYGIGKVSAEAILSEPNPGGKTAIIAIPQKRINGQTRTTGFLKAIQEHNVSNSGIREQADFSYEETYRFTKELLRDNPGIKVLWLEGSNRYQAALDAIKDTGKSNQVFLATYDAEPEFLDLIPRHVILASGMQQPYMMGRKSVELMDEYLQGGCVPKNVKLPVLVITRQNIGQNLPLIRRNVLGMSQQGSR